MTFAVLPFVVPTDDKTALQIAAAMSDAIFSELEKVPLEAQVVSRRSVEQALVRHASDKDVASSLNVPFLLRGNVTRVDAGYKVDMLVVDAATERVIGTTSVAIPAGALTPHRRELARATDSLHTRALELEVERARSKRMEALDVRDLTHRAIVDWTAQRKLKDDKGAYITATDLLNRALVLAPDNPLALRVMAVVNLCDCVDAWSTNVDEQLAIGMGALEKYLRYDPQDPFMLILKSHYFALRGRHEESLLIADAVLKRDPDLDAAVEVKAYDLLKLGRPQEALAAVNVLTNRDRGNALAAAIHYELARYESAAQYARKALSRMERQQLGNPRLGAVSLTLVAAEARLGREARAKAALAEFNASVPGVHTISAIKKWMHPAADLASNESLFNGLRLAGIGD